MEIRARGKLGVLPPPLAGEGWGGGTHGTSLRSCPLPVPPPQAGEGTLEPRAPHSRQQIVGQIRLGPAPILALALLPLAASAAAAAGDVAAGRRKALQCQTCHGLDGLSKLPEAPHLAGQPEQYLFKSLNEYRSGARKNDMMSLVAPALSDQDVADLAA